MSSSQRAERVERTNNEALQELAAATATLFTTTLSSARPRPYPRRPNSEATQISNIFKSLEGAL